MSEGPEPSRRAPRTSQREVKSCGFCYRRKLKCDKVYPCSRCVARGLGELCEKETVIVNGRITGATFERSNRRQPTLAQVIDENKSLHRKVSTQENVIRSLLDQIESITQASETEKKRDIQLGISAGPSSRASSPGLQERGDEGEVKSEYLTTAVEQVYGLSKEESAGGQQPNHLFTQPGTHTLDSLRMLVPVGSSSSLVKYHCNFLHWIHAVFHQPTFLAQHDQWIEALRKGERVDVTYDFYALYFAVIASSLYFMDTQFAMEIGLTMSQIETLPRFWFDTSLNCLQLAGFMIYPTIPILQAICVLPIIAHAFDSSKYLSSLMHCGLGLARDLNLHLVQGDSSPTVWGGNIKSQIVRRIWWCLMIADSLTPGARHPYHLMYPPAWTSPPANANDYEINDSSPIVPLPLDRVTCVSHLLIMNRLAELFRAFTPAFLSKTSASSRFRVVKDFNDRLDRLFDDCPELRPREDEIFSGHYTLSGPFDWRPWSRYLWATALPATRIQLWRWHLGRSYSDPRFLEARQVCVASARAMISVRSKPVPVMFQKNWHVSSHTVICGMVLASELLHGQNDMAEHMRLHEEVQEILRLLRATSQPNGMIQRGLNILAQILAEAETTAQSSDEPSNQNDQSALLSGLTWPVGDSSQDIQLDLFDMFLNSENWVVPEVVDTEQQI